MKCPKCDYLGFETGDRCKNCGYDFSLLSPLDTKVSEPDLPLRTAAIDDAPRATPWIDQLDRMFGEPEPAPPSVVETPLPVTKATATPETAPAPEPAFRITPALDDAPPMPPPAFRGEPALPLFSPSSATDDEPLVKLPATPRPPLAVRKTPDRQRLRAFARPMPEPEAEPTLEFAETPEPTPEPAATRREARQAVPVEGAVSAATPRLTAALIDHAILFGIDLLVIYFTLRLASLTLGDWRALPPVPLIAFLAIVKVAYFASFTAVGGQTIGKMAAGIRVITDDRGFVDPSRAIQRTLAGAVSFVTLGLAFIPALFGADKRALHDRVAHTRVVALP